MEEPYLYQQIIQAIRQEILSGSILPGEKLPSIRLMTETWGCTAGTVQRAYHELSAQGLVVSRPGQGTHVVKRLPQLDDTPLRRASLVNRAQAFLLEVLTAGYTPAEVEIALQLALDQWRIISHETRAPAKGILRFSGSHDLALAWIGAHFSEIVPQYSLEINIAGSLGGLIALAEGQAEIAGCHLWDEETDSYNLPFIRRFLPGQRVALLTLAWRHQGLITPAGNPLGIHSLADLTSTGLRFINRQPGSGTRVWLNAALHRAGIPEGSIHGYQDERQTHSEVARAVADRSADVGFGLQTAAQAFGLHFIPLVKERYDLVIPENGPHAEAVDQLAAWIKTESARKAIAALGGYDTQETGELVWIN